MDRRAEALIAELGLEPHPEGGYFTETFRSSCEVSSPVVGEARAALTDIYFLLVDGDPSRFHRIAHDELWHFHEGAALELFIADPSSLRVTRSVIGPSSEAAAYRATVPGGCWQAAQTMGAYSLVSCAVGPGFDSSDFSLLRDTRPDAGRLIGGHPELRELL